LEHINKKENSKKENRTITGTKSIKVENLSKEQRLRKKDILDPLVATFPAGNSLARVLGLA
jgi:hypothetical protein